ncbi:Uncharacterised protein [Escherichia coli]|nr:Uncharacterised protein [Escherichia coli]
MTWQTDNADVVREVFTAKTARQRPSFWASSQQFLVPAGYRGTPDHVRSLPSAVHRNSGALANLTVFRLVFRRRTANHKRDMVRRAGCSTEGTHFSRRGSFSVCRASAGAFGFPGRDNVFVGRAAAFSDTEEFVLIAIYRVTGRFAQAGSLPVLTSLYMSSGAFCE